MRALIFLLLIPLLFASCHGYTDSFEVRVLNKDNQAVEGAEVWVKFDTGRLGQKYFTTEPRLTDERGKVKYTLINKGERLDADCNIYIWVRLGEKENSTVIKANRHPPIVDIWLEVWPLDVYVYDDRGRALEGATIAIAGKEFETDERGHARLFLPPGDYSYLITYQGAERAGTFTLTKAEQIRAKLIKYKVNLEVVDERGRPLNAVVEIGGEKRNISGSYLIESYDPNIPYKVYYKDKVKEGVIDAARRPEHFVVFDNSAPLIANIQQTTKEDFIRISFTVIDEGQRASGVDPRTISFIYAVKPPKEGEYGENVRATVFSLGNNIYAVDLDLAKNSLIKFEISASDLEGNVARREGILTIVSSPPKEEGGGEKSTQENPPFNNIFVIIFIIVAVALVYKYIIAKKT